MAIDQKTVNSIMHKIYNAPQGRVVFLCEKRGFDNFCEAVGDFQPNAVSEADPVFPDVFAVRSTNERGSIMTKYFHSSNLARRLVRGAADVRGTSGARDLAAGEVPSISVAASQQNADVVELSQRRAREHPAPSKSSRGAKHQLQLRVDSYTRAFIDELMARAEAESVPEVVRLALREYERVWHEYDGNIGFSDDLSGTGGEPVGASSEGDIQNPMHPSQKSSRLNIVLGHGPMARLKRLVKITDARSQSEVIRFALCVLDVQLDAFDSIVSEPPKVSALSGLKEHIMHHLELKRRSIG